MEFKEFCDTYNISGLNPQQKAAVTRVDGATLLLAVPGSGKTTVIVTRTGYMLYCAGIDPRNILTLTFTVAAANEMKERFLKKFDVSKEMSPHFSTIHSFCVSVIKTCQKLKGECIPRLEPNIERVIREICISILPEYPSDILVRALAQKITNVKNRMIPMRELEGINVEEVVFKTFYELFNNYMDSNNLMDFDDQLVYAYRFLQEYPDILEMYQDKYRYISIDEAQDTSLLQHKIIQLLAKKHGNIFMVGDDDQSIYGFRGAYPEALINFSEDYPGAAILSMETNYRSTNRIVNAANKFIKRNKARHDKNMVANSTDDGSITCTSVTDAREQYKLILKEIQEFLGSDRTLAILYRNNESAIPIINLLQQQGIHVRYRDEGKLFFTYFVVSDILNFLRLSLNMRDVEAFRKIYFKLGLYLPKSSISYVEAKLARNPDATVFDALKEMPALSSRENKIEKIGIMFKGLQYKPPVRAIETVMKDIGYKQNVLEKKIDDGYSETSLLSKVNTLMGIGQEYAKVSEFLEAMEKLQEYKQNYQSNITLSTIHSSKGLEFDKVIMIDVIQGLLPSDIPDEDNPEEDGRLFYVGTTRAKSQLEFITAKSFFDTKIKTSEFIQEFLNEKKKPVPPKAVEIENSLTGKLGSISVPAPGKFDVLNYPPDTVIEHKVFGRGTVISIQESGIAEIKFSKVGTKKLDLKICCANGIIG